jgi:hypothetical protein
MRVFSSSEYQRILALPKALVHLTNRSASKLPTNSRRRRRHHQEAVRRDNNGSESFCVCAAVSLLSWDVGTSGQRSTGG